MPGAPAATVRPGPRTARCSNNTKSQSVDLRPGTMRAVTQAYRPLVRGVCAKHRFAELIPTMASRGMRIADAVRLVRRAGCAQRQLLLQHEGERRAGARRPAVSAGGPGVLTTPHNRSIIICDA